MRLSLELPPSLNASVAEYNYYHHPATLMTILGG
jgi:hypothetical protein